MFWYHLLEQIAASICPWLMAAVRAPRHGRVLYMFQENLKLMEKVRTSLKRSCALSIQLDIEELSKKGANGTEIFSQNFWKIWRLLIFRNVNHATENSGNLRLKINWDGNSGSLINFRKFGYTTRDCPFLSNSEWCCSFAIGNFWVSTPDFLELKIGKREPLSPFMDTALGEENPQQALTQ